MASIMAGERGIAPMTIARVQPHDEWLQVDLSPLAALSEDDFFLFCQANHDLRLERLATGEIVIMPPEGWGSGRRGAEVLSALGPWAKADGTGVATGSSAGFRLPTGAVRAPDAAWVRRERLAAVPAADQERFLPLCPDFVVEVRSPSDSLQDLLAKMAEYVANGARLGWLIDPQDQTVHVFRAGRPPERLERPRQLDGETVLPGFRLDLDPIW